MGVERRIGTEIEMPGKGIAIPFGVEVDPRSTLGRRRTARLLNVGQTREATPNLRQHSSQCRVVRRYRKVVGRKGELVRAVAGFIGQPVARGRAGVPTLPPSRSRRRDTWR